MRGKGIDSLTDLAGKKIALAPTARGVAMVRHLLQANGIAPDNWTVIDSGFREVLAKEIRDSNEIDATFGTYWAWDVILDESLPDSERIIWPIDTIGAPLYLSYLLGALGKHVRQNPQLVTDFVAATKQGYLEEELLNAAKNIADLGAKYVLIKGGHRFGTDAEDVLYSPQEILRLPAKRINTTNTHGTGCTLSSAIASQLSRGDSVTDAVKTAKTYISQAIADSYQLGKGVGPVGHLAELYRRAGVKVE